MGSFKRKAGLFGLIGTAAMLVAACGSSTTGGATTTPGQGYDFSYTAKTPATKGGQVVFGDWQFPDSLSPIAGVSGALVVDVEITQGLFNGCILQLPDLTLGIKGWVADQCAQVPTVDNGLESKDGLSTTMKLDPKAHWSDSKPITADDYMLQYNFATDPNVGGGGSPWTEMKAVTKVDDTTIKIDWKTTYAPYLSALWGPVPLHIYNTGKYAGLYDGATGKYSTDIAQKLITDDIANTKIEVTNGPFTVQSFAVDDSVVLVKNPQFYSNYFKGPFLDKAIFKTTGDKNVLIQSYKAGQYAHIENFTLGDLPKFAGVPANELIVSPQISFEHLEFNQRPEALSAKDNPDKTAFLADPAARQALVQAFDRCAALVAILGVKDCNDPNISTGELTAPPGIDFDPTVKIAPFDLNAANAALDTAGYKIVNGKRTYKDGKTPITITITSTSGNNLRDSFLALMKQSYGNLNINVVQQNIKASKYFTTFANGGTLATGAYDVALFAFVSPSDPNSLTSEWQGDQVPSAKQAAGQNYTGLKDSNVDAQLAAGRQTLDFTKRAQIYKDLQKYVTQQNYFEALYIRALISLTKPTLGNFKAQPTSAGDTWNMADWYTTASA